MQIFLCIGILILLCVITYLFTPIFTRKTKLIFFSIILLLFLGLLAIPNNWICSIKLPVFNKSINVMIDDFINKSDHLSHAVEFTPAIRSNLVYIIQMIVKGCILAVFFGGTVFVSSLVFYILSFKHHKVLFATISFVIMLITSFSLMFSPVCAVPYLYNAINKNTAKKDEAIYQTYPEFNDYKKIFQTIEIVGEKVNVNGFGKLFVEISNTFSFNRVKMLTSDLNRIDYLLTELKNSGITIIYTNDTFWFEQTTNETFDFDMIKKLIKDDLNTTIYNDMARSYTNDILKYFEEDLKAETGKNNVHLQLSRDEFEKQYEQIIDLLSYVAKNDLVNLLNDVYNDFTIPNLYNHINDIMDLISSGGLKVLLSLSEYPLVKKIRGYYSFSEPFAVQQAGLYTCMKLYKVLDEWLLNYRYSDMYNTSKLFLQNRGII